MDTKLPTLPLLVLEKQQISYKGNSRLSFGKLLDVTAYIQTSKNLAFMQYITVAVGQNG